MAKADLTPLSSLATQNQAQYMAYNFERLDLLSEVEKDVVSEIIVVTGTLIVTTFLASAEGAVAVLAVPPVAGACFVTCTVVANSGNITLKVYDNAFAASIIAVPIQYLAIGVMSL